MAKIALLAGSLSLPRLVAESCREQGRDLFVIALNGITDPTWVGAYPHQWVGLAQAGKIFRTLDDKKCTHVVMAGAVKRPSFAHLIPDAEGLKILWQLQKNKAQGDDAVLRRLAHVFEQRGFAVIGADSVLPESVMPLGILTQTTLLPEDEKNIHSVLPVLQHWAENDLGQAIVVQQGMVLGIEAIEGTDALIKRCGAYKREGRGPILLKIKKPHQDTRLDLPTIGDETVRQAIASGFAGIVVQAQQALFLDPATSIALADKHGLFIVGMDM